MPVTWIQRPSRFTTAVAYSPNGVVFDGTSDYLTRGADFTGNADSADWTVTFALRLNATGQIHTILMGETVADTLRYMVRVESSNVLRFLARDSGGTTIHDIESATALSTGQWYAVLFSVDGGTTAHLFVDDTDDIEASPVNDAGTVDFTVADHGVGNRPLGTTQLLDGELADPRFWPGGLIDFSQTSNRRLFFDASNCLVEPASDGAITGLGMPILFLGGPNDEANWATNRGSGGGMTETGDLTNSASDPCGA